MRYDLEERLVNFAVGIITVCSYLPKTQIGIHLSSQLSRSGTSPALNYGEAQAAESKRDFIHKMKICLKELRETSINLKIIIKANLNREKKETFERVLTENTELIAIFTSSIKTAKEKKQM